MPQRTPLQIYELHDYQTVNTGLAQAILALAEEDFFRRSHFFHGRYENLYTDAAKLPGLQTILATILERTAQFLGQDVAELRLGFWLNIMHEGDVTSLHSHDDDDELLSAVYYVQVPQGSASFRLHLDNEIQDVAPQAGRLMLFDPTLPHEVGEHHSDIPRISIGMNIGPAIPHDRIGVAQV